MVKSYFTRAFSSFVAHVFDIPARLLALLSFLILLCIPLIGLNLYYLTFLTQAWVYGIFAASWDLLVGRTGQISLGHAVFFGIGGYATAMLFTYFGLPIWLTIPIALVIGSLVALILGVPCLRVKGPYLALVTMAFPIILESLVKWSPLFPILKGELGFRNLPVFFPFLKARDQIIAEYYFILVLLFASAVILYKVANSKTGIVLVSILDNEPASKACGINVTRYKLLSFTISGLFASLAGCLQAHLMRVANPPLFGLTFSFIPIIVTFLGGLGTIYGPLVGAFIYSILDRYVLTIELPKIFALFGMRIPVQFDYAKPLIFSLIVLIMVIKWPRGLARFTTDKLEDLEKARDIDERGPRIWKKYKKKEKK